MFTKPANALKPEVLRDVAHRMAILTADQNTLDFVTHIGKVMGQLLSTGEIELIKTEMALAHTPEALSTAFSAQEETWFQLGFDEGVRVGVEEAKRQAERNTNFYLAESMVKALFGDFPSEVARRLWQMNLDTEKLDYLIDCALEANSLEEWVEVGLHSDQ